MIPLSARLAQARVTISAQRRQLLRLQRERTVKDQEIDRLRRLLTGHPDALHRLLLADPDEVKRLAVMFHDRCLELTRANATQKCRACRERTTAGEKVSAR